MKKSHPRSLWFITIFLILFAIAPIIVSAQTETATRKTEAKASGSEEITLTISGSIQGGRFFFKEKTIQFDTQNKYMMPSKDIFVNGKPWDDLSRPFKLDFTPDFAKAVILQKDGGFEGRIYIVPRDNLFALMIVPREKEPEEAPFRVTLAVKNQIAHANLPPDETPLAGGTPKRATVIAPRKVQNPPAVEERLTLVLAGEIEGNGKFRFQSNRIEYHPDVQSPLSYPEDVTVNGNPWKDLHAPFYLDFVTDYTTGKITARSGDATVNWRGIPVSDSIFDRYERSVGELSVADDGSGEASPFMATVSLRKFPQDYAARIIAMLNDGLEKSRKGSLENRYLLNEEELTPDERKKVEQWREERQKEQLVWMNDKSYTTDGKELPFLTKAAVPGIRPSSPDQFDITVEAVVNCSATFAFLGDKIVYGDQSYPNEGKYPRQVRINGKPWKNLHLPFTLDSEVDPDFIVGMHVETEYYRYYLWPEGSRIALGIVNHGPRDEEPVQIRLSLRKKPAPAKTK